MAAFIAEAFDTASASAPAAVTDPLDWSCHALGARPSLAGCLLPSISTIAQKELDTGNLEPRLHLVSTTESEDHNTSEN